jgi:hypothetical protein
LFVFVVQLGDLWFFPFVQQTRRLVLHAVVVGRAAAAISLTSTSLAVSLTTPDSA